LPVSDQVLLSDNICLAQHSSARNSQQMVEPAQALRLPEGRPMRKSAYRIEELDLKLIEKYTQP